MKAPKYNDHGHHFGSPQLSVRFNVQDGRRAKVPKIVSSFANIHAVKCACFVSYASSGLHSKSILQLYSFISP